MDITTETPRAERTIGGFKLQVPQPYAAGQVLTEATASILNQTFGENISNNTRKKLEMGFVPEGAAEGAEATPYDDTSAQALIDAYVASYEPGVRRGGGGEQRVSDPVEKEARTIAKAKATELVKARGLKVGDVNLSEITGKLFDANKDALMKAAKKIVDARNKTQADDGLSFDGIDFGAASTTEAAA